MKQVSHLAGRVHSLLNHLEIAKDKELQDISHQLPIKYQKDGMIFFICRVHCSDVFRLLTFYFIEM